MAHTCPDCGMLCRCGGDIDDIDFGDDTDDAGRCTHCICRRCGIPDYKGCDCYESDYDDDD